MTESRSVFVFMMREGRARGNLGGGNEYGDYLYCVDDFTLVYTFQNLPNMLNYTLNVQFIICQLYVNKAVVKGL